MFLLTGVVGLEPTATNLEDWYSIQLSYTPIISNLVKTTKADNEARTRTESLEDSDATVTPYPRLEQMARVELA